MRTLNSPAPDTIAVHRHVTDTSAAIGVRGLRAPFRVLHVSDSHIDDGPEPGSRVDHCGAVIMCPHPALIYILGSIPLGESR